MFQKTERGKYEMKKKLVYKFIGAVAAGVFLAGCGDAAQNKDVPDNVSSTQKESKESNKEEKVEISYTSRGNAEEIKIYQQAVDEFNKIQDKIHVTFEATPGDGYSQQQVTQLAGGTAADVIFVEDTIMSTLTKNGTIANLEDFLKTENSYVKAEDYDEGIWGAAKNKDGIFGLSVDCNPVVMYYSPKMLQELKADDPQELFEKGEWTWDNFDKICDILKENGKSGLIQSGDNIRLYNWVFANGGSIWDGDTYKFDDKAKEAFEFVCERVKDGRFVYGGTLPSGQGEDAMFMSGQTGFITAGRWLTKTFYEEGIDFDYIPYPTSDGSKYSPAQNCAGYLSVNAKSEHLEEAMIFASFYAGEQGQKARLEGVGNAVPSVKTIDDLISTSKVPEHVDHILKVRANGWALGEDKVKDGLYPGFLEATKSVFEEAYVNGTDPEQVLKAAEEKGAQIIAEDNE